MFFPSKIWTLRWSGRVAQDFQVFQALLCCRCLRHYFERVFSPGHSNSFRPEVTQEVRGVCFSKQSQSAPPTILHGDGPKCLASFNGWLKSHFKQHCKYKGLSYLNDHTPPIDVAFTSKIGIWFHWNHSFYIGESQCGRVRKNLTPLAVSMGKAFNHTRSLGSTTVCRMTSIWWRYQVKEWWPVWWCW